MYKIETYFNRNVLNFYLLFFVSLKTKPLLNKTVNNNLKTCHFTHEVLSIEKHIALHGNLLTVGRITQSPTVLIN